jgi:AcrR family transcriptional regulator
MGSTSPLWTTRLRQCRLLTVLGTPNRDRVAERRAATRQEIVDAAWDVAREQGLAQLTLRDVAARVGMKAPSLYSHVNSKNGIYDAMFAQAWTQCREVMVAAEARCPPDARGALRLYARAFFDFSVSDLARFQLMNQRTIPGFEPSPEAYEQAVQTLGVLRDLLARHAITAQEDIDLYVALVGGLADAQLANDPGGDRWSRLLDRAIDMYLHDLGIETEVEPTSTHEGDRP